jgi:hypothetical protein
VARIYARAFPRVSVGGNDWDDQREGGPNPALTHNLPGWLLPELREKGRSFRL